MTLNEIAYNLLNLIRGGKSHHDENISLEFSSTRTLVKIFNLLGQEVIPSYGQIAIYIYDDGSVEKRFVLE